MSYAKCCGTCKHTPFPFSTTPTGRYKKDHRQTCMVHIPLPVLPDSCNFGYQSTLHKNLNFLKGCIGPNDGQNCSFWELRDNSGE